MRVGTARIRLAHWPAQRLVAGAVVAMVVVAVPLASKAPELAVAKNPDGTVTVRINEFVRPKELGKRLREEDYGAAAAD
ncbi:hypothetical protein [Nonomuraea composti]|uniref:hypothetical protein n=1 Tax=Nonomuraea composti TaxID=2720023 RepID=UPI001F0E157C|nr:hypothetical protein [Nonomuraea sp. FMUSA5-5]